jgi:hypothetical protein
MVRYPAGVSQSRDCDSATALGVGRGGDDSSAWRSCWLSPSGLRSRSTRRRSRREGVQLVWVVPSVRGVHPRSAGARPAEGPTAGRANARTTGETGSSPRGPTPRRWGLAWDNIAGRPRSSSEGIDYDFAGLANDYMSAVEGALGDAYRAGRRRARLRREREDTS